MGSIHQPSDYGRVGTEDIDFIRCVEIRDPQLHGMWCLGSDKITRKIHPTARLEVGNGTLGLFTNNYLDENGRRIPVIGQLSINGSVQFLGIPNFFGNSGLLFIENLKSPTVTPGWGHSYTTTKNWLVIPVGPYRMWSVPWVSTVPSHLAYMPGSPENPRTAARRICDDFLRRRRCECMMSPITHRNLIVNPSIHCHGDDHEGPFTQ